MLYLGLDVHSKWMTVRGFEPETGEEIYLKRVSNESDSVRETFLSLKGPIHAAYGVRNELVGDVSRVGWVLRAPGRSGAREVVGSQD